MSLKILTFNIHKGFNWSNSELTIERLRKNPKITQTDIVFLQEVVGENKSFEHKFDNWINNQFEYLAKNLWNDYLYSKHAVYDHHHHGNVILSKFPILETEVRDLSINSYKKRSIMFAKIQISEERVIHTYCTHLNLLHRDRKKQYSLIKSFIEDKTNPEMPLILAGDFNDWNQQASKYLFSIQHIHDAHKKIHSEYARTFPAIFPLLKLDRLYTRGFKVSEANVLEETHWKTLSDHLPLYIEIDLK